MSTKSIINYIILLIVLLGVYACQERSDALFNQISSELVYSDSISILALGDSYTFGISVSEDERWPNQLADTLELYDIPVRGVDILAQNGWTSTSLLSAMKQAGIKKTYDLVGILIGVNDQVQRRSRVEYENNLKEIVSYALNLADNDINRLFILSIPDYTATPFGNEIGTSTTDREIAEFNRINKAIADQRAIKYFNITPLSKKAADRDDLVAPDELHFSGKMYALWVDYIKQDIISLVALAVK
jgi:lysophospholipase L1-like esterase